MPHGAPQGPSSFSLPGDVQAEEGLVQTVHGVQSNDGISVTLSLIHI